MAVDRVSRRRGELKGEENGPTPSRGLIRPRSQENRRGTKNIKAEEKREREREGGSRRI